MSLKAPAKAVTDGIPSVRIISGQAFQSAKKNIIFSTLGIIACNVNSSSPMLAFIPNHMRFKMQSNTSVSNALSMRFCVAVMIRFIIFSAIWLKALYGAKKPW